ncbi:hypothetical protein [Nocardiopsis sp. YSL2]|uniref:hypothetical protein n=1 Tax=Nocardiopsis sp. YSL2 TaxID=2939492 RepID=UPI0026F45F1C|nr:hypothetical protein [Nocardiopsis sp. YSL2]
MARPVHVASGTGGVQAATGAGTLVAFTATGSAASVVRLHDGTDNTGPVVAVIGVPAGNTAADRLAAVDFTTGVFIDRDVTNASEFVLYLL